MEAFKLFNFH